MEPTVADSTNELDAPLPAPVNLPLTDSQKLRLANAQRKMLGKRMDAQQAEKEAQSLEQMLQRELAGIAALNHIDFTVSMLSEDFDIVPLPKRG